MRALLAVGVIVALSACGDRAAGDVNAPPSGVVRANAGAGSAMGPPATPPGGGQPVGGSGTAGMVPVWTGTNALGDSRMKIDANGDVVLRPGAAIILISADGTKCFRLAGEALQKLVPPCPVF